MALEDAAEGEEGGEPLVSGTILIPAEISGFGDAAAHVRLEEIIAEDISARVIAETTIPHLRHEPADGKETIVPFAIRITGKPCVVNPRNEYAVRVWIDHNGDGKRGPGDLYSDERHSVFKGHSDRNVIIRVIQRQQSNGPGLTGERV
jgi:uncharacterized lipoprotein YbaY